jgi:hypothetical protein
MKRLIAVAVLAATSFACLAQTPAITVTQPWVRATVAEQKSTGAFMTLQANSASRLVAVQSSAAASVEMHEMAMDGDVMRMRALPAVALAAGADVTFKPGSYHLMLMGLKKPLKAGETVPLTLMFESADGKQRQQLEVQAEVRPLGSR